MPRPVVPLFAARVTPDGVRLSGHPPKSVSHSIGGRFVIQQPVAIHTSVDAVVIPTQQQDAIGSNPKPTLPDRYQQLESLLPDRQLPVRNQLGSGGSMALNMASEWVVLVYQHY